MSDSRVFKVKPEYIAKKKRNFILHKLFMVIVALIIGVTQGYQNPANIGMWTCIGILVLVVTGYMWRTQSQPILQAMKDHSIAFDNSHIRFFERGRETRIAYDQFTKAIFVGTAPNVRSVRLIAADWMDEELPEYEDFQLVASMLLEKLPASIIKHKER